MFLFVSHARFKQTGLSSALLLLSLTAAHADVSDVAENLSGDTSPDVPLDAQSQQKPEQETNVQNHQFPHWPHYMQGSKSIIPPPPPGPYKSSALNDYAVSAPVYRSVKPAPRRQPVARDAASMPMDMFSPDIPWPDNLRPEQQMPEHHMSGTGQPYARPRGSRPQAMLKPPGRPAVKPQYGHNQYGYNYGRQQGAYPNTPYMNDMGMRSSRWMPGMSMAPPGPYNSRAYSNRWNYAPDYGSNYGVQRYDSRYARPATNNRSLNPANPAYR